MLKVPQILVRAIVLVGGAALLAACGQKGPLFTPVEAAGRQRATLVQTLRPGWTRMGDTAAKPAAPPDAAGVAAPASTAPAAVEAPPTQTDLVPESTLGQ